MFVSFTTDQPKQVEIAETPVVANVALVPEQFERIALRAGWPQELVGELSTVVQCESTFRYWAVNNGKYFGLLQIEPNWFNYYHLDFTLWSDPYTNLHLGWLIYNYELDRGYWPWSPWPQCGERTR